MHTWNMARKLKITENGIWKNGIGQENEKCTLKDLEYVEKTENHGINEKYTLQDVKYREET